MNIESLNNLKYDRETDLFNLFEPSFVVTDNIELFEYTITRDDEMRIDMVFKNIYQIDISMLSNYLNDVDVLLYINGIDNALNIKEGFVFRYPAIGQLPNFRFNNSIEDLSNDVVKQLAVPNMPNKITKVDRNRRDFIESDYSLSPVVSSEFVEPVRIEDGNFTIGGINN
jgi:hypothetical protein